MPQEITVMGAGNGGCALAADLTLRGFDVTLFELPQFEDTIEPIRARGGIQVSGESIQGFAELKKLTTDMATALDSSDLIMVVVPAFAHAIFAKVCAPYLRADHTVVLNPGSTGGALEWAQVLQKAGNPASFTLAETLSLPYACRKRNPTHVDILGVKSNLPIAALPSKDSEKLVQRLEGIYPEGVIPASNVLETSLNNLNAIAHPMAALLNVGWIEATDGNFSFYGEATTPSVAFAMEEVDRERLQVAGALGLEQVSLLEWDQRLYGLKGETLYEVLHNSEVHRPTKAPPSLKDRYITEDIPYGLVPIAGIASSLGLATPATDLFINLAGLLNQTDYMASGRTAEKLGLAGMNAREMIEFVTEGTSSKADNK